MILNDAVCHDDDDDLIDGLQLCLLLTFVEQGNAVIGEKRSELHSTLKPSSAERSEKRESRSKRGKLRCDALR